MEERIKAVEDRLANHEQVTTAAIVDLKESVCQLNHTVETQLTKLIEALTGVNKIDTSTVNKLVGIFGAVVLSLVVALIFVVTGRNIGFLPIP